MVRYRKDPVSEALWSNYDIRTAVKRHSQVNVFTFAVFPISLADVSRTGAIGAILWNFSLVTRAPAASSMVESTSKFTPSATNLFPFIMKALGKALLLFAAIFGGTMLSVSIHLDISRI